VYLTHAPLGKTCGVLLSPTCSPSLPPSLLPPTTQIWDLGGQQGLRPFWATYFKKTDAVVMVVDSTDRARVGVAKVGLNGMSPVGTACLKSKGAFRCSLRSAVEHDTGVAVLTLLPPSLPLQAELMGLLEHEDLGRTPVLILANKQVGEEQ
jgi:GTPase SAR1 family protein